MDIERTGERVIEDAYGSSAEDRLIYLFHVVSYEFAKDFVRGKDVLDYGCGTGYGTQDLAADCATVVGVDISEDAIEYASANYSADNLTFQAVEAIENRPLPYDSDSFDVVVSFQVIEHIRAPNLYLQEVVRVLKPGGVFLCATPDRSTRLFPGQKPWNMWHVREFNKPGLVSLLFPHFDSVDVLEMSGTPDVLDIELRRTKRLRWLTIPLTLPIVPEFVRIRGLAAIKKIRRSKKSTTPSQVSVEFTGSDLVIGKDLSPSVNLVAVATLDQSPASESSTVRANHPR